MSADDLHASVNAFFQAIADTFGGGDGQWRLTVGTAHDAERVSYLS